MSTRQVAAARSICTDCPVKRTCLVHALLQPEPFGIWGGYTTPERKRMFRAADQALNADAGRVLLSSEVEQITRILTWFDTGVLEQKVVMRR